MTRDEFDLLAVRDEPSVIDRMTPPTLDEWTVAIETLKTKESGCVYFERNGVPAVQYEISSSGQGGIWTYNDPGNAMNYVQSYGINQQNSGQYQSQALQNALAQRMLQHQPALVPIDIDKAECLSATINMLHAHRINHFGSIPDSASRTLSHAEQRLNEKLSDYMTHGGKL